MGNHERAEEAVFSLNISSYEVIVSLSMVYHTILELRIFPIRTIIIKGQHLPKATSFNIGENLSQSTASLRSTFERRKLTFGGVLTKDMLSTRHVPSEPAPM